ncbi:MAG: TIGR02391 family protein [Acidobacteriia bacterium]|nr:TIGR02391 family protein [Terriglobia bacterium]
MASRLERFEAVARKIVALPPREAEPSLHPFDTRNIHPGLPAKVRQLFDDGYFAEATFEAFKFLDKTVERHSTLTDSGYKLMMAAFSETSPKIALNALKTTSEKDEQQGYKFIFAGGVLAIRNPRGHEHSVVDDPDNCLDHLGFVSLLLRRLEQSGFV